MQPKPIDSLKYIKKGSCKLPLQSYIFVSLLALWFAGFVSGDGIVKDK